MNSILNPKFLEGGHAIFTVANGKGEHFTFRIGRKDDTQPLFVGLLTGPDNEASYTYMGVFTPATASIRLTAKSKFTSDSKPVKVAGWAVKQVATQATLPVGYTIQHAGKCCVCGRTLTTPESIDRGIGPECIKKSGW